MTNGMDRLPRRNGARGNLALSVAVATVLAIPTSIGAFEFDTGSEDLSVRWDNTVRANIATRVGSQDEAIIANPNFDDGDRNFDQGSWFTRLDLLSEFDVVWKRSLGFRVSAAGWWDPGYGDLDNKSIETSNNLRQKTGLPVLGLDPDAQRYAEGPSGEFLDVFAFAKFNVGEAPVNVKLGQTTVYWGEGLLLGGAVHGISYSQNPIDVWKALATPGAEAKELFRPRVGFNVQSQVTDTVSLAAQYFFNWQSFSNQAYRYPESGTYLSVGDPLLWAGESFILGPSPFAAVPGSPDYLRAWRGKDILPEENSGNYGVALRWSPLWADATFGAYYRRTYDMQPQLMLTPGLATTVPATTCVAIGGQPLGGTNCIINKQVTNLSLLRSTGKAGEYNAAFGEDVDMYGLSLSKQVLGVSLGAELNYRQNMPLVSEAVQVLPAPLVNPSRGQISTTEVPKSGYAGCAWRHDARRRQSAGPGRHDAAVGFGQLGHGAHLDDRAGRDPERGRVQGPQQQEVRAVPADRSPERQFLRPGGQLYADLVPGPAGRGHAGPADVVGGRRRKLGGDIRRKRRRRHVERRHRGRRSPARAL